jgi:HEPN domain-containing protein
MPTREQLKTLAQLRLREAEALFENGLYDGCAYMCGYVVEIALKAKICKTLGVEEYPDEFMKAFRTHDFDELKLLAGMQDDPLAAADPFLENWSIVTRWEPEQRYEPQGTYDRDQASIILNAIRTEPDGVLPWLSLRW